MEEIGRITLERYGLFGLMVLFNMAFCWLLFRKDGKKDEQLERMSNRFADSLDKNTVAINQLIQSEDRLTTASSSIVMGFDRMAEQNRQEHTEMLRAMGVR